MEPDQKPGGGAGDAPQGKRTPNTDMQPEDAGTADSGNDQADAGRGTAAEPAMKQTDKTEAETGSRRG